MNFKSICQNCVYGTHPIMLTTYCLTGCKCDLCGRVTDLAMVRMRNEDEPYNEVTAESMNARLRGEK